MRNKFRIPEVVLAEIRERDRNCVYCQKVMVYPFRKEEPRDSATIEHLNFDGPFFWDEGLLAVDVVMCCGSCNSSRGQKPLADWFASAYCIERTITAETVATPVREYLRRRGRLG
jgi:hypothetical protein